MYLAAFMALSFINSFMFIYIKNQRDATWQYVY